ncbi:MAG: carboxypeptidase-like regulatory domain-containing protein [Salinibacter sp.]|uniref:carboxypeptidase-like regulatory domain-containing protein n=1 Tax=Salinibacter sp. TaxID=2065818 RepID=UPI0035D48C88
MSGTVTEGETGEPLPGVNVTAVGTTVGTTTNPSGEYSLTVPEEVDSLAFSFVKYQRVVRAFENRSVINVTLRPAVEQLEDVVVTALSNVATFLNPEAWVDHRHHNYDHLDFEPPVDQNPDLSTERIRRALYLLSDIDRNRSNVPDVSLDGSPGGISRKSVRESPVGTSKCLYTRAVPAMPPPIVPLFLNDTRSD